MKSCWLFHSWSRWWADDEGSSYAKNFRHGPNIIEWRVCIKCGKVQERLIDEREDI